MKNSVFMEKPCQKSRVAKFLGKNRVEIGEMVCYNQIEVCFTNQKC
jgi:hypothetical protein